jgi:putative MFS transporter
VLISFGAWFQLYNMFYTVYIAPGLFKSKIFDATTAAFFGMGGFASFIASLFVGLFIGTIGFSRLADRFGRRVTFTGAVTWFSAATAILAFQTTTTAMDLWHLISGIGIGVSLATVDAYISEIVPKHARGKALALAQGTARLCMPTAAFLAWVLDPVEPFGLAGWRWVVLLGGLGAILIWLLRIGIPESPRWLAQPGRIAEADRIVRKMEAHAAAQSRGPLPQPEPISGISDERVGTYAELFSKELRHRTIMLSLVNFFSTVGYFGFVSWIPTLLIAKGIEVTRSLEYTFIIALSFPAGLLLVMLVADRIERKWQIIGSAVVSLIFSQLNAPGWLIAFGCLQTWASAWMALSLHSYQAELFPTRLRARGVGFVFSWSRFSAIFTGFFVASFLRNFGEFGVFLFIASAMAVMVLGLALFGPRTTRLALEDISH